MLGIKKMRINGDDLMLNVPVCNLMNDQILKIGKFNNLLQVNALV